MNAMAMNMETGEIIDPFNGQKDIKDKIIRHVSDAFVEDPVRVLRVARFAAVYNFKVAEETMKLMKNMKDELKHLTPERVLKEMMKAFKTRQPSKFFNVLRDAGALAIIFPEIERLRRTTVNGSDNAYVVTMQLLDMAKTPEERYIMLTRYVVNKEEFGKRLRVPSALIKKSKLVNSRETKKIVSKIWKENINSMLNPKGVVYFVKRMKDADAFDLLTLAIRLTKIYRDSKDPGATDRILTRLKNAELALAKITGEDVKKNYPELKGKEFGDKLMEMRGEYMIELEKATIPALLKTKTAIDAYKRNRSNTQTKNVFDRVMENINDITFTSVGYGYTIFNVGDH